jgi:hypothetical protein
MALRTSRDLASTAIILNRSEDAIRNALKGDSGDASEVVAKAPPKQGAPARQARPDGQQRRPPGSKEKTDYRFGGEFWVVIDSDAQEIRKIRTGVTDLNNVEIISGLDASERVLVLPSSHLLETQQDLQDFINKRMGGVPGISR